MLKKLYFIALITLLPISGCKVKDYSKNTSSYNVQTKTKETEKDSATKSITQLDTSDSSATTTYYLHPDSLSKEASSESPTAFLLSHSYKVISSHRYRLSEYKKADSSSTKLLASETSKLVDSSKSAIAKHSDSTIGTNATNWTKSLSTKRIIIITLFVTSLLLCLYLVKKFI